MSKTGDFFDPRVIFSSNNPFLGYAKQTHHRIFEAFDKTAHVQLSLAQDLLDLNRKRFEALYAGDGLGNKIASHQDLAMNAGKRAAAWAGDLQEIMVDLGGGILNAAIELLPSGKAGSPRTESGEKGARDEN
jgi:hypothetical protein